MTSIFLTIALILTAFMGGASSLPDWLEWLLVLAQGGCIGLGYTYEYCVISKAKSLEECINQLKNKK